jgi:hypothetical protein
LDNFISLLDLIELIAKPFSRAGRRELTLCVLILGGAVLVGLSAFYLVYGRGPACKVAAGHDHRSRNREANWARLSETGTKAVNASCN